ncbi:MAG TPA: 3-hydroxyacyl-CoA dehydrogenase NAD-binding domain-containing protein, partial [Actinomycetota bacterium]|nr:3-hydroxyacyl-CoA dehydrogenase NAD-binding domain-containing protein [Actinomycetota bacterium]
MRAEDVRTVGVIGCGLMGSGISEVVARAGQTAVVLETSDELVERGRQRIETSTLRA